jgi:hypothetical protein
MIALRAQGRPLRAIADAVRAKGYQISHESGAGEGIPDQPRGRGGRPENGRRGAVSPCLALAR